jgi:gamma-glutamyltranspeptidase/glutathione hydrolase
MDAAAAVDAPRLHWEDGSVYTEPGIEEEALEREGYALAPFRERNLFFGGCQAVERAADGVLSGGGDPRRGGAVKVTHE